MKFTKWSEKAQPTTKPKAVKPKAIKPTKTKKSTKK